MKDKEIDYKNVNGNELAQNCLQWQDWILVVVFAAREQII
jgi:hypothetical protein